jgi:hypothetical protein
MVPWDPLAPVVPVAPPGQLDPLDQPDLVVLAVLEDPPRQWALVGRQDQPVPALLGAPRRL